MGAPAGAARTRRYSGWMHGARVLIYTKPGCHLCDDMLDLLEAALRGTGIGIAERNIALDLDDYEKYKHDIPVLMIDGRLVARHRIAEPALAAALREAGLR